MELTEYLLVLRRRKGIIIAIFLAAVISAAVASFMVTPVYQASTWLLVKSQSKASALEFDLGTMMGDLGKNDIQNYVEVLKSRRLAAVVAGKEHIDPDRDTRAFASLRGSISIQPVQGTDAVRVNVQSTDPRFAQRVADRLVGAFTQWCQLRNQTDARAARLFIAGQLKDQQRALDLAEESLQRYKQSNGVVAPDDQVKAQLGSVYTWESDAENTRIDLAAARQKLAALRAQLKVRDRTLVSSRTLQSDPSLQAYKSQLFELETKLADARQTLTDSHPTVIDLKQRIDDVRKHLNEDFGDVVSSKVETINPLYEQLLGQVAETEGTVVGLEARSEALKSAVAKGEKGLASYPGKELTLARLTRTQSVAEDIYLTLLRKLQEAKITEAQQTAQVDTVDKAALPISPIKPKKKLNVAIAGFLGLFVGCGLAFMLEYLDSSMKTTEDIERYLELPVMGVIPIVKDQAAGAAVRRRRRQSKSAPETEPGGEGGASLG